MRRVFGARSRIAKIAVVATVCATAGGVAYAASGSAFVASNGSITSCLPPKGGQVHIWKPGHRCSGGWVGLSFAANGATGPSGATGATGATNPDATSVDGQTVSKLALKQPTPSSGTATATLYSAGGLTILAQCDTSGDASLEASGPASADSELTVSGYDAGGSFGSQTNALGSSATPIASSASGEISFSYASSAGSVASGELGYQSAPSFASYAGCAFFGDVTTG